MGAALALSLVVALAWLRVLTGWGAHFPSQRPPLAVRTALIALLSAATAALAWYAWNLA